MALSLLLRVGRGVVLEAHSVAGSVEHVMAGHGGGQAFEERM